MPKKLARALRRPGRRPAVSRQQNTTAVSSTCCLGIDIGSHRTRICIWADGSEIIVENKHSFNLYTTNYPGDFPSALYVFEEDSSPSFADVYLVDREDPTRLSVSAKYVFYALTNASDALLEQYPPVHHLVARKEDPKFKEHLRSAMVTLLSVLRDCAMAVCRSKRLQVAKVGLTIPVQWTLEFEDVYRELVSEVFKIDPAVIYFFTETEALARYLFKHHAPQMDPDGEYNTINFYDFGGHNMNGCVFGVARDLESPERNSFYRVGRTFGAGGGSEQWEHHIGEWFSDLWLDLNFTVAPPQYREELLFLFRRQKSRKTDLRESVTLSFTRPNDGAPSRATLTPETIEDAWRKGLNRPLETARREIARLVRMVESGRVTKPLVVVSGGTARNPAVKSRMMAICEENGVPVVFTDDFAVSIAYDSAKVAKAAAYVVSETLTVEQFFARGAAIGIQMKQSPSQGQPKGAPRAWDNSGALLLDLRHRPKVELAVRWRDEFQLVCDPFYERLPRAKRVRVAAKLSYDLVYLGKRKQGTWSFQLSLEGSGDKMELVLQQFHRRRRDLPWKAKKTLRLPLYFDGNSGCVHVGERNKTADELDLGLPPQPNDTGEADIYATEESEQESDSDPDSERAPETASSADAGIVTGSSNTGEDGRVTMFAAAELWQWPGDEEPGSEIPARQLGISPTFDGLPSPQRITSGVKPRGPMNHRVDPYGLAWRRKDAGNGFLS